LVQGVAIRKLAEPLIYYRLVLWRAFQDTFRHFVRQVLVGLILLGLATWIRCLTLPRGQNCDVSELKAGFLAVAFYFAAVVLFNVFMAPVRIHREQSELIRPEEGEPTLVRLVSRELHDPILQDTFGYGDDFAYSAHQTSDGIELSWSVLRREGERRPPYIPREAKCVLQVGDKRVIADASPTYYRASCTYPKDFDLVPTTGHLEFSWEGEELKWPLPPVLGGPRETPPRTRVGNEGLRPVVD